MANEEMLEYLWTSSQNITEDPIGEKIKNLESEIFRQISYYKARCKTADNLKKDLTERLRVKEDEILLYKSKLSMLQKENEELKKKEERDKRMWVPHREYARLHQECRRKDERIERLERTIKEKYTIFQDREEAKKEGERELIEQMIKYAEKLSKRQSNDFLAVQNAILLVIRKLPNGVINDELEKRLENIGIEDDKPITTIDTKGGPVILGGKFDNTDFVAQKRIESK